MNRAPLIAFAVVFLAACAPSSSDDEPAALGVDAVTVAPDVARQYVQYNSNFAFQVVVLHRDGTYHVVRSQDVFTGTWRFDLPASKVTLTPAANSAPPPELEFPVKRDDCEPRGWFPVLMRGDRKMIPYGIDPEFEERYCHLFSAP